MTDKLELKSCHEVVYTVDVADVDSIFYCKPTDPDILTVLMKDGKRLYCDEVCPIDSLQEEPVSEDLEEAAKNVGQKYFPDENNVWAKPNYEAVKAECAFKDGARWQKGHLWKPADGDDLPIFDREVIVLVKYSTQRNIHDEKYPTYRVEFGHRPNPDGWDGKSITTGKVEHYTSKTYDKGGWNIPNVKYWLDCSMPKEIEL